MKRRLRSPFLILSKGFKKMLKKMVFVVLIFLSSFSVFADTYPVVITYKYYTTYSAQQTSPSAACTIIGADFYMLTAPVLPSTIGSCGRVSMPGTWSTPIYIAVFSSSCPSGGTISGANCINAPACTSPYVRASISPYACGVYVPPDCLSTQNPINNSCKFPANTGVGISCTDGSSVYAPAVCPVNPWDWLFMPKSGQSATCSDGRVIAFGQSCLDKWFKSNISDSSNPAIKAGVILAGIGITGMTKPVLTLVGTTLKMVIPIAEKIANTTTQPLLSVRSELSAYSAGDAIQSLIKANPTGFYATAFKNDLATRLAPVTIDQLGNILPVNSVIPYTSNQVAAVAFAIQSTVPLPLTDIAPFVNPQMMPWVEPSLNAFQADSVRVQSSPSLMPFNFPSASMLPVYSPLVDVMALPQVLDVSPLSPQSFGSPAAISASTLPSSLTNTNPLATDAPTLLPTTLASGSAIPSGTSDLIPVTPSLYPDTFKFFDFLPTANPFKFDPSLFMPVLPNPSCYYEIHQTIAFPLMGSHAFDVVPCAKLAPLRAVLKWVFAVLTAMTCFFLIFKATFNN
jgi:hypothetical protein